jgi:hypothetical protein
MDTADEDRTLARFKKASETAAQLKPEILAIASRRLRAGATNKQLAEATGLTTEFFRKLARDIGADNRAKAPTVGREVEARRAASEHAPPQD